MFRNPKTGQFSRQTTETQCVVDKSTKTMTKYHEQKQKALDEKRKRIREAIAEAEAIRDAIERKQEEHRILHQQNFNRAFGKLLKGKKAENKKDRDKRLVDQLLEAAYG